MLMIQHRERVGEGGGRRINFLAMVNKISVVII